MKFRTVIILLIIFCVLGAGAWLTFKKGKTARQTKIGEKLFTSLPVNDVERIRITGPEGAVALKKGPSVWVVESRWDYNADFAMISELLRKIKDLKVGRSFKASPEVVERLELTPPDQPDAPPDAPPDQTDAPPDAPADRKGVRVKLDGKDEKPIADILLGKARETDSGIGGHNLMLLDKTDSKTVFLVDEHFKYLKKEPSDWLAKDLLDIKEGDIQSVVCHDPATDAVLYSLSRPEKGKDPVLADLAEGETVVDSKVDKVFDAFSSLRLDDVVDPGDPIDPASMEKGRRFVYRLHDGREFTVESGSRKDGEDQKNYLRLRAGFTPPPVTETPEKAEEQPEEQQGTSGQETPIPGAADATDEKEKPEAKSPEERMLEARELDEKLRPWTYIISTWKHESFVPERETLIEKKEKETGQEEQVGAAGAPGAMPGPAPVLGPVRGVSPGGDP